MNLVYYMDLFGVAVFAISGALAAGRKRMDPFGVIVLATVTAIGGGTLRDMALVAKPVFWVDDPTYLIVVIISAISVMITKGKIAAHQRIMLIADAFGLALFSVLGAKKALDIGASGIIAIVMGMFSAVVGGIIRDVLSREVPLIFQRDIYATASILGGAIFIFASYLGMANRPAMLLGFAAALILRLSAIRWHLSIPILEINESEKNK